MINQVNSVSVNNKNPFAPFSTQNGANYAITKPFYESNYIFDVPKIKEEKKNSGKAFGISIAMTALVAGFAALLILKKPSKGGFKKLDKFLEYLENKTKSLKKTQTFALSILEKTKKYTKKLKSLFNLSYLKDLLVDKTSQKIPGVRTLSTNLSELYEKISEKVVKKAYTKTGGAFEDLYVELDKHGNSTLIKKIQNKFEEGFGGIERGKRLKRTKDSLKKVADDLYDDTYGNLKKFVKDKKTYETNLAEDYSTSAKLKLKKEVSSRRNEIANEINTELLAMSKNNVLSEKEYKRLENSAKNALKSLDKSIDVETDKLFEKLRDIKLGSAPTEFLGILTSLGVIALGLTKADNNDERVSVSLKYGIPTVGAIVTSLLCMVGLVAGGTSIVLGLASGLIMNKIGAVVDKAIKDYKQNKPSLNDISLNKIADKITS